MAINKKLIHFKTFANFNSKKLSANEANTQYTLGVNGTVTTGDPEILYQSVCWIKDTKQQWTHGQLYDLSGSTEATTLAYAEYTGTSTAVVVTTIDGYFPTTLVEGAAIAIKINAVIKSISSLNVNGTGVKNVRYKGVSLSGGSISQYNTYLFIFDGTDYQIVGVDTDTHYTAKNVITSSSTSTSNATATNGNVYLNVVENSTVRSSHTITGTGGTTVTSDASGHITIDTPLKTINGESLEGSGDITIEVQDSVTESVVSGWGFTKNTGTITEVKANGTSISTSGVANIPAASTSAYGVTKLSSSTSSTSTTLAATASAVKAAYDLANGKQAKLTSGTNIMTARGQSILTSGDLFDPIIITTNVEETQSTMVGRCYVYPVAQTTAKTFVLSVPNNIWNDSINIIINTSTSITFRSSNALPIMWANGTTPTFDSDKVYEISFRYTPMGWLGVAVAFHSA